jgi:hypothetical protein
MHFCGFEIIDSERITKWVNVFFTFFFHFDIYFGYFGAVGVQEKAVKRA